MVRLWADVMDIREEEGRPSTYAQIMAFPNTAPRSRGWVLLVGVGPVGTLLSESHMKTHVRNVKNM